MAVGIVDRAGAVSTRRSGPTPRSSDPEVVFATLAALIIEVIDGSVRPPVWCGVGCGGPLQAGGDRASPLNIPGWSGFSLRHRITELISLPVSIDNDAKALALAEGWLGAARNRSDYLAMVVSTGVGGGIVLDGHLLDGANGNAGHIGHVVVEPEGRPCGCGGYGCLEAEASGPAIEAVTGHPPAEASAAVRRRTGVLVGRAVACVANLLDLSLAVVAGSVALGFGEVFFDAAQEEIERRARLEFSRTTIIEPAGLGADGPLVGAAALAFRAEREAARRPGR